MPRQTKSKQDDPAQSKRFIDAAREVGADEDPAAFERVFKRVVQPAKTKKSD